jgi:hypothetical protein
VPVNSLLFLLFMASKIVGTGVGRLVGKDMLTELMSKSEGFYLSKILMILRLFRAVILFHFLE